MLVADPPRRTLGGLRRAPDPPRGLAVMPSAALGFRVPFDGHVLVGDVMAGEGPPRLLLLHGAGAPPAGTAGVS